ncbi:MAG: carboxylesterase, partial [Pseudomonadota bacterium]
MLAYETIETGKPADTLIIWLHGLGADGFDFMPVVPMLSLSSRLKARICFPHAPMRPVTLNQGHEMPAWFDIKELTLEGRDDAVGMAEACTWIDDLRAKHSDIPDNRVAVVGFSQGAALALHY